MLLRHFVAHLGSLGSTYRHCPARQAKKSMRKKNKCDDSWALANESWSETSQKRISILHQLTYGAELATGKEGKCNVHTVRAKVCNMSLHH